jgi:hypothetical protein
LRKVIVVIAVMFFAVLAHSQSSLSFCTFVNSANQECIFENTRFITTPDSTHGRLFMLLRSAQVFGTTKVTFKVYGIDRFGAELFLFSLSQDVQAEWMNSWQPAVFTSPGKYMVKVYKDETTLITSKGFEFFNY